MIRLFHQTDRRITALPLAAVLVGLLLDSRSFGNDIAAADLVEQARQAEAEGDTARQFALLRKAVRLAPEYEIARWHLGQMKIDGKWITVEQGQRSESSNSKLVDYRHLRAGSTQSLDSQLALARWCQRNDLRDEARFHWSTVLTIQPTNDEALGALGLRLYGGQPMAPEQIAQIKQQARDTNRAVQEWQPKVAKWRRAISGADADARKAALDEIRGIHSIDAIPALEIVTLGRDAYDKRESRWSCEICLAFVDALGDMQSIEATKSLLRHALRSPAEDVRKLAIDELKGRPQHEFIPLLLNELVMPVESSYQIVNNRDGSVHYYHTLYREGQHGDWAGTLRRSVVQGDLAGPAYTYDVASDTLEVAPPKESHIATGMKQARVAANYTRRYASSLAATERQVSQENRAVEDRNARLIAVLVGTTGKEFGNLPTAWWKWWREQNEYYSEDGGGPTYENFNSGTDYYVYRPPTYEERYPPPPPGQYSCFAKGTLVWTKTGQQPIETLELGDMVLAQNVDTGELAYKPVIGRTVRPPSGIIRLSMSGEQILTTRGHPFWVAGVGWRMAKELESGAVLHGVTGGGRIAAAKEAEPAEAYNLIVADFGTYFVGESGFLVHDNTPRRPTRATVPGLSAK